MKGVFTQFVMVIISIGIVFTYIKPAFDEIEIIQNETKTYEGEIDKVLSVNSQLSDLQTTMESVSMTDRYRLLNYLPDSIDEIKVLRDLYLINKRAGTLYVGVTSNSDQRGTQRKNANQNETGPDQHAFNLSVEGTYTQVKNLFRLLEQNNYPLEVQNVSISPAEGGFLSVSIDLVTYSFKNDITSQGDTANI
jgi:hypothetical protein